MSDLPDASLPHPTAPAAELSREELVGLVRRQQAVLLLQREIIDELAHEVRTPIAAIQNACFLIDTFGQGEDATQRAKWQGMIKEAADALRQLMTDIVDVKEREASARALTVAPLSADALVREAVAAAGPDAARVHVESEPEAAQTRRLDRGVFLAAFTPLLRNALLYSDAPKPVDVTLSVTTDGRLAIKVRDEGRGIPADERSGLFTPFHRASNVDRVPGSGLGLAVARCAAELHGGAIGCESCEGEGSTFELTLLAPPATGG